MHRWAEAAVDAPSILGATWWDALQAIGTLLAVIVAVTLALAESHRARDAVRDRDRLLRDQAARDRRRSASLVGAWIEVDVEPSEDGTHYIRRGRLYLANEGTEPVFAVSVGVGVNDPPVQVGPLSAPIPIPVLAPRTRRSWDVATGLLAHSAAERRLPTHPVAWVAFTDAEGIRWHRDFAGVLAESEGTSGPVTSPPDAAQMGPLDNPFNPLPTALAFLEMLAPERQASPNDFALLVSDAPGWSDLTSATIAEMARDLAEFGLAAHVWYAAPYVAYVRLVHDDDIDKATSAMGSDLIPVHAKVLTLVFAPDAGWRVFSIGVTEPDWIGFPAGTLGDDPRRAGDTGEAAD